MVCFATGRIKPSRSPSRFGIRMEYSCVSNEISPASLRSPLCCRLWLMIRLNYSIGSDRTRYARGSMHLGAIGQPWNVWDASTQPVPVIASDMPSSAPAVDEWQSLEPLLRPCSEIALRNRSSTSEPVRRASDGFFMFVIQAREAKKQLATLDKQQQLRRREAKEAEWLVANREAYMGQWVALDGDQLLASGSSAREVFAAVAGYAPTPLVTKIRPDSPFAGW